jgi:hypothetical protein
MLLSIAHFPNLRGIKLGAMNEVVNTDQPGAARTMYSTAIVANVSCGTNISFFENNDGSGRE